MEVCVNRWRLAHPRMAISILLIALTLAVFLPVVGHKFVLFDDEAYVTQNANVQAGISLESLAWAFTTTQNCNWHPLSWISHMADCQVYGLDPRGHHATSLLLHVLNVVLLFLVLDRVTRSPWRSGFVAALFAIHPLHVESVAWVAERKDVLSTLFWILTMLAYARYAESPSLRRKLPVIGFFALGLLAKPMLVTLPVVLLLLDYWPLHRFSFDGKKQGTSLRALLGEKLPLFVLSGASCVITYFAQNTGGSMPVTGQLPFVIRAGNALLSYFRYIEMMFRPRDLTILYPYTPASVPTWTQIYTAAVALILITALIIWLGRRHGYLPVGWLWYLVTLLPVVGLVQVGEQTMADRYTYVPLIGLFVMIAWLVPELLRPISRSPRLPILLVIPAIAVIASMAVVARHQVGFWKDSITLFAHTIAVTSDNYTGYMNLGLALSDDGQLEPAIEAYQNAARILPNKYVPHTNLAVLYYNTQRYAEAWEEVHTCRSLGFQPSEEFLDYLIRVMPDPGE